MKNLVPLLAVPFLVVKLGVALATPLPTDEYRQAYDFVRSHQTADPYQREARDKVLGLLDKLSAKIALPRYSLVIARIPPALKGDLGVFYTSTCSSLAPPNLEPLILCNEDYLYEIEAAVRANEMASIYQKPPFSTDPTIFAFVRDVTPDPKRYALAMRSIAQNHPDQSIVSNEAHIREHLELALLFFAGHELGHLRREHSGAFLMTVFSPNDPLEDRIEDAVVRMCRHAEEFWKEGNGLDGYEWVQDLNSPMRREEQSYIRVQKKFANAGEWYRVESEADQFATQVMLGYLEMQEDTYTAAEKQYFLVETLHAMGVYSMYRDLALFADRVCLSVITRTVQLMPCMAMEREQYVKASSILSNVHRPVLLRTKTAIHSMLESRDDKSGLAREERKTGLTEQEFKELLARGDERRFNLRHWYAQNWQRLILHEILTDTHVKLTMHGCATGWIKEIDRERGTPQGFLMVFEGMEDAIRRMMRVVGGKVKVKHEAAP